MKQITQTIIPFILMLFMLPFTACVNEDNNSAKTEIIHVGDSLPYFVVTTLNECTVSTDSLKGTPSLIVFFNTECSDCQQELPLLQKVYETYGNQLHFLCIARDELADPIRAFWSAHQLTMPVSPQPDRSIFELFATRTIPRVYLADANAQVTHIFIETIDPTQLNQAITQLLGDE